jgi:hypothetical protein
MKLVYSGTVTKELVLEHDPILGSKYELQDVVSENEIDEEQESENES